MALQSALSKERPDLSLSDIAAAAGEEDDRRLRQAVEGKISAPFELSSRIADAYGVNPNWLLHGNGAMFLDKQLYTLGEYLTWMERRGPYRIKQRLPRQKDWSSIVVDRTQVRAFPLTGISVAARALGIVEGDIEYERAVLTQCLELSRALYSDLDDIEAVEAAIANAAEVVASRELNELSDFHRSKSDPKHEKRLIVGWVIRAVVSASRIAVDIHKKLPTGDPMGIESDLGRLPAVFAAAANVLGNAVWEEGLVLIDNPRPT